MNGRIIDGAQADGDALTTVKISLKSLKKDSCTVKAVAVREEGERLIIAEISGAGEDDWVRLYNAGTTDVELEKYCLSDNPQKLQKYRLPAQVLVPGESCRIFGKDNPQADPQWTCGFNFARDEVLTLSRAGGLGSAEDEVLTISQDSTRGSAEDEEPAPSPSGEENPTPAGGKTAARSDKAAPAPSGEENPASAGGADMISSLKEKLSFLTDGPPPAAEAAMVTADAVRIPYMSRSSTYGRKDNGDIWRWFDHRDESE